jgi:laminin beta 1
MKDNAVCLTACDCHPGGSTELQCDRTTGQCPCQPGVTGMKCDRCDRGTTGELPNCKPCGECYDNWDAIISELRSKCCKLKYLSVFDLPCPRTFCVYE